MEPLTGRHFTDKELEAKAANYGKAIQAGTISPETVEKFFTPNDYAVLGKHLKGGK